MANGTIAFDTLSTSGQISGTAKSVDTDYLAYGSAKVWYGFDLHGGQNSFEGSFNASSGADNGTGDATITYTNNMDSTNYIFASGGTDSNLVTTGGDATDTKSHTASTLASRSRTNANSTIDSLHQIIIMGSLA
tara:strand:+ start:250 stop:651 length:402 start_codon:yes stop_codon:yes gene_type:complete